MATNLYATVALAADSASALERVARHVAKVDGFSVTGNVATDKLGGRTVYNVELSNQGGKASDLWVVLTSYGISPSKSLRAHWQSVAGVGR